MERYPNRAYDSRLGKTDKGEHLLSPSDVTTSGRKLYSFSGNLNCTSALPPVDDQTCALPPVVENKRRGMLINQSGDGDILWASGNRERQHVDEWDDIPTFTLENVPVVPRVRLDWREERKMRVENAMRRVEQSYVGELRYENQQATYVRPATPKLPEKRRPPHGLVPLERRPLPGVEVGDLQFQPDIYNADLIDKSVLIPSSVAKAMPRNLEEEMELDIKRQVFLERKIKEANEFHRKQKLNAHKPVKENIKRGKKEKEDAVNLSTPQSLNKPIPPITGDTKDKLQPAPPSMAKKEDSFSKRKRGLKPCAADINVGHSYESPNTVRGWDVAPPSQSKAVTSECFSYAIPGTTREGRHGMSFDVDTSEFEQPSLIDAQANVSNTKPKPPLIPRQASFNIWNGETAKRGLGFKSKLRKEMEEASLGNVVHDDELSISKQSRVHVSSDVAAKWKRKMFRNN